jgi:hypothetical protein
LVDVAEHEDGEKCGNGAGFGGSRTLGGEVYLTLEFPKDVSESLLAGHSSGTRANVRLQAEGDDDLEDGREHESPCPPRIWYVHPGGASNRRW